MIPNIEIEGMTPRHYLAGQALVGILSGYAGKYVGAIDHNIIATKAVQIADAILASTATISDQLDLDGTHEAS